MNYQDFGEIQGFVQLAFKAYGYSWEHPRVVAYLKKVQAKTGRFPTNARPSDCLSIEHYQGLAMNLAALVVAGREAVKNPDAHALAKSQSSAIEAAKRQIPNGGAV